MAYRDCAFLLNVAESLWEGSQFSSRRTDTDVQGSHHPVHVPQEPSDSVLTEQDAHFVRNGLSEPQEQRSRGWPRGPGVLANAPGAGCFRSIAWTTAPGRGRRWGDRASPTDRADAPHCSRNGHARGFSEAVGSRACFPVSVSRGRTLPHEHSTVRPREGAQR